MLIRSLEVHVGRPAQLGPRLQDGGMAASRVEPYVEDVRLLPELLPTTLGTARARRQEVAGRARIPLVGAPTIAHDRGHVLDQTLLDEDRLASVAVERDDGHAPHTLTRDGPVGTMGDHVEDAVTAPGGDPCDLILDGVERALAESLLVQGDEPLLGGAEQRGVLTAPAVRILMAERHLGHERADLLQVLDDLRIR